MTRAVPFFSDFLSLFEGFSTGFPQQPKAADFQDLVALI